MCTVSRLSNNVLTPAEATPIPAHTAQRVEEMEFSEKLRNPCSLVDASQLDTSSITTGSEQQQRDQRQMILDELKAKAVLLKDTAGTILRRNVLQDCNTLELPTVAVIPSEEDLNNKEPVEILPLFYTSLLNHTAHMYFISDSLQQHASDGSCNNPELVTSAKSLATNMRALMCLLRFFSAVLEATESAAPTTDLYAESTQQILDEELVDQPVCSLRLVRDCQTVGSSETLLRRLSDYLERKGVLQVSPWKYCKYPKRFIASNAYSKHDDISLEMFRKARVFFQSSQAAARDSSGS
ncbi:uncharacterized protein LOC129224175 [Uloborus diversus]|uniref:uncharacterized protein LOC129224175 n=1 Tax=Uloborus diversus TaxID=327109 RepID=UPI002409599E|nr:uncharacterized protein LOC129224175 [Uloborus diversus]